MQTLYFEDFQVGDTFHSESVTISESDVIGFAEQFDPQYFHLDKVRAKDSFFNGLAASGWHTSAISMRLMVNSGLGRIANGMIGLGVDELRWPQPTYAGDAVRVVVTVLATKASKSQPGWGIVKIQGQTYNQHDAMVMQLITPLWVQQRS